MKDLKNIIIMKCGTHASEKIEDIYNRKKQEESSVGYFCWGYGGTLCHPLNQVQPFCKNKEKVYLLLTPTTSELNNVPQRSNYYSIDKETWNDINLSINVLGSKYAIVANKLQKCDLEINLNDYEIGVGNSLGKNLGDYLKGRVDKACAIKTSKKISDVQKIKIVMIAELVYPYSVFVR